MVTEGVELLAHRPLEVSPFNEDEPQVLRHASTREAFVRLVHYYLLLAEVRETRQLTLSQSVPLLLMIGVRCLCSSLVCPHVSKFSPRIFCDWKPLASVTAAAYIAVRAGHTINS